MSTSGDGKTNDTAAATITVATAADEDLVCPRCQYNLRGLTGDPVTCPECGLACDLAALHQFHIGGLVWNRLPCLVRLRLTAVAGVGFLLVTPSALPALFHLHPSRNSLFTTVLGATTSVALLVWWVDQWRGVWRTFGSLYGLYLAALMHGVIALLMVDILVLVVVPILAYLEWQANMQISQTLIFAGVIIITVASLIAVYLDLYIRQACKVWHLIHVMMPASAAAAKQG